MVVEPPRYDVVGLTGQNRSVSLFALGLPTHISILSHLLLAQRQCSLSSAAPHLYETFMSTFSDHHFAMRWKMTCEISPKELSAKSPFTAKTGHRGPNTWPGTMPDLNVNSPNRSSRAEVHPWLSCRTPQVILQLSRQTLVFAELCSRGPIELL